MSSLAPATRVLLLEDSSIDAELLAKQLKKVDASLEISRAASRRDFEALLAGADLDLILSDYSLPDFFDFEALDVARQAQPDAPFIYVSGVLGEELATEALRAGATDYVTKRDLARIPMVVARALRESAERRSARRAARALRESEERFSVLADSTPAFIWLVGPDGEIVFANRRFETDLGVPSASLVEGGWQALIYEEDRSDFIAERNRAFAERRLFVGEARIRDGRGDIRWLKIESSPRWDGGGEFLGYSGCAIDVTQTKSVKDALETEVAKRTEELRLKEEVLRQAHKMEAIGQLTGGIAHDFNNMLAGIVGGSELIRRRLHDGRHGECLKYIDAVIVSAERAAALTQRLLAFSRRQTLDIRSADANGLISSCEDLLRRTIGESIRLSTRLAPDLWPASTDPNQFESAILNLAINARDAMPSGGDLIISSVNASARKPHDVGPGDYVIVQVADTGLGMTAEVKEKVFDPFFTTKPIGQGTGLGLSMIYGFMAQIGGHIRIDSEPNVGTTVSLYLPRGGPPTTAEVSTCSRTSAPEKDHGAVLVVEDEAVLRMLIGDYLRDTGYDVTETDGALSAISVLSSGARIDLLLTDVGLPGMNGRELAREARRLRPDLSVIFATGYADGIVNRGDLVGEGMDLVVKPFDLAELGAKIRGLIAR